MEEANYEHIDPLTYDYKNRKETCCGCGLTHHLVEAIGIYHCPNPLCMATGAIWFRGGLKSFKEDGEGHTIDPEEWIREGIKYLKEECKDEDVKEAGYRNIDNILKRFGVTEEELKRKGKPDYWWLRKENKR